MQQPAVSINQKPQILTRISNELGVTTMRLSCLDEFFFLVVVAYAFMAECNFLCRLCSMTHLLCPNRGKNVSKKDKVKVKRI